jgi:hypothetical protein
VTGAALPRPDDIGHLVAAVLLGAMLGAAAALAAIRHVATLLVLGVSMVSFPVAGLLVWLHADAARVAAVVALVALAALALAPAVSGKLAELTAPDLPRTAMPATEQALQEEIAHLVTLGRRTLLVVTACCAVVLATAVVVLGSADYGFAIGMALSVSLALLVRSGQTRSLGTVLPVIAAGCAGFLSVLLHGGDSGGGGGGPGPLVLVVLAAAAVIIGVTGAMGSPASEDVPSRRLGGTYAVLVFVSVMCAFGVFGVFAFLMHLGEGV